MRKSPALKLLSVLGVAIALIHLSPITTGLLLCIGEAEKDCCPTPHGDPSFVEEPGRLVDGGDCTCCVEIETAPSTAGALKHQVPDVALGVGASLDDAPRPVARVLTTADHDPGQTRLTSVRSVVLLI